MKHLVKDETIFQSLVIKFIMNTILIWDEKIILFENCRIMTRTKVAIFRIVVRSSFHSTLG